VRAVAASSACALVVKLRLIRVPSAVRMSISQLLPRFLMGMCPFFLDVKNLDI